MKAVLLRSHKVVFEDGAILQIILWQVPTPVPPAGHRYKYRLYYGKDGVRLVGYDNERGKGDHRHFMASETGYSFTTLAQLLRDFRDDVNRIRSETL